MFISSKTETGAIQLRTQTEDEMVQGTDKPRVYECPMEDYIR